jgi:Bacterial Ig domain/Bacterial TSP3 repeat
LDGISIISIMIIALILVVIVVVVVTGIMQSLIESSTIPIKTTTTTAAAVTSSNISSSNRKIDSDGDGLSDDQELNNYRTNPLVNDTDGDILSDGKEVNGWSWAIEEKRGCTPTSGCHIHKTNPLNPDTDGDGNDDYYEYSNFPSDPNNPDQDNDGLLDGLEWGPHAIYHTSYFLADTDHDGFSDGQEIKMQTNPLDPSDYPFAPELNTNRIPIANPGRVLTTQRQPVIITLTGSDPDGDQLFFFIFTQPNHGSLGRIETTGPISAQATYIPVLNYTGADSFTFLPYDGKAYGSPAVVSIIIYP